MISDKQFDKIQNHFGYGLVRVSPEFKLIDKNIIADKARVFPKRGASILKLASDGGIRLISLSEKEGENIAVSFSDGIKTVNALAIREKNGNIILLIHPLISSVTLGKNAKASRAYGINILNLIYGEKIEKSLSVNDIFPFSPMSVKRLMLVTTAMKSIAERLSLINFKNSITLNFESMEKRLSKAVDFTAVVYALTEILSLESTFSDGKSAIITFSSTDDTLDIILNSRLNKNCLSDTEIFSRLFSDALKLVGVDATVKFGGDGFLFAKASVSTELTTSYVRVPGVYVEEAVWAYFDYVICMYGLGEKEN